MMGLEDICDDQAMGIWRTGSALMQGEPLVQVKLVWREDENVAGSVVRCCRMNLLCKLNLCGGRM